MTAIYSLALSARMTINMHSLNNEGGEGNQIQTRMVDVIGEDGKPHNVNAISGDMLKHIQAEHLYRLAQNNGAQLCAGCARFDANRISSDSEFVNRITVRKYNNAQVIDDLLQTCVVDDLEGNLVTTSKKQGSQELEEGAPSSKNRASTPGKSVPRKSVIEFGWVVGIPEMVRTEQYFHAKYNPGARTQEEANVATGAAGEESDRGSNLGQAIFYRPASSGVYAVVAHLEAARIGYNDITQRYAIDAADRTARLRLLLQSLLHSFVQLNGAMRNTQLPHLVALEGVITVSHAVLPAPTVSPLNSAYREQIERVHNALNELGSAAVPGGTDGEAPLSLHPFDSLDAFARIMAGLAAAGTPYSFAER